MEIQAQRNFIATTAIQLVTLFLLMLVTGSFHLSTSHAAPLLFYLKSIPNQSIKWCEDFSYQVEYSVTTPQCWGDKISFSLLDAPSGMTIDSRTGLIRWDLDPHNAGSYEIRVRAQAVNEGDGEREEEPSRLPGDGSRGSVKYGSLSMVASPITVLRGIKRAFLRSAMFASTIVYDTQEFELKVKEDLQSCYSSCEEACGLEASSPQPWRDEYDHARTTCGY